MIKKKKNFIIYLNQFFNNKSIYQRREEKRRKKVRNIHNILPLPPKKEKNVNSITFKRIKLHETSTSVHRLANVWLTCHALAYTSISLSWLVYASISAWFSGRRVQVRDPERGQILTSSNVTIVLIVQCRFEETLSVGHPDLEPRAPPRADASKIPDFRASGKCIIAADAAFIIAGDPRVTLPLPRHRPFRSISFSFRFLRFLTFFDSSTD